MTDREPDNLFDALRDRLADYGQEPPAPLWAGIRAQLPPPVASPQLRRRRWQRAPVALLLLLLVMSGGLGWHWWQAQQPGPRKMQGPTAARPAHSDSQQHARAGQQSGPVRPDARGSQPALVGSSNSVSATENSASNAQNSFSDTGNSVLSRGKSVSNTRNFYSKSKEVISKTRDEDSTATRGVSESMADRADVPFGPRNDHQLARGREQKARAAAYQSRNRAKLIIGSGKALALTQKQNAQPRKDVITGQNPAAPQESPTATVMAPSAAGRTRMQPAAMVAAGTRPGAGRPAAGRPTASTPAAPAATPPARSWATQAPAATRRTATEPGQPDMTALTQEPAATSQPSLATSLGEPTGPAAAQTLARLPVRVVALHIAAGPALPRPQPIDSAAPVPPAPLLPRWSVQLLAGPALTYRQLSGAAATTRTSPTPATASPGPASGGSSAADVAALERPALAGGFQLSVRRALTERWSLSLGLGYAEFATRLALQQVRHPAANAMLRPDSVSRISIHRRDTYRFVTLPLQLGYTWPLAGRWQVGVLAGAELALYVGGSSTEGSPCACQTQTWGVSGSPYRRVSLGASLGAEVRYRLNGRWELLAQPTATYLLTPLAKPASAYYQRHLFGGTALLGASYTLP